MVRRVVLRARAGAGVWHTYGLLQCVHEWIRDHIFTTYGSRWDGGMAECVLKISLVTVSEWLMCVHEGAVPTELHAAPWVKQNRI